jgi:hypothetical protein
MKTQVIHQNDDTVNQALKMSEELQALRKENETLRAEKISFESEREDYVSKIKSMEKDLSQQQQQQQQRLPLKVSNKTEKKLLDDLRSMQKGFEALYEEFAEVKAERDELLIKLEKSEEALASAKEASATITRTPYNHSLDNDGHSPTPEELRLAEQVRCLQVSCDSLFSDLDKMKKERDELKAAVDSNSASRRPAPPTQSKSSMLSWMTSSITSAPKNTTDDNVGSAQASFLMKAVERHGSNAPSSSSNPLERKLQELEVENLKLKSSIVYLQSQYKEERYKNQQLLQERFENTTPSPRQPKRSVSLQVPIQHHDTNPCVGDGCDDDDLPSSLADEGRRSKLESVKALPSPKRSASLRRIHEYRAKKEPSKEASPISTVSTKDTAGTDHSSTVTGGKESLPSAAPLTTATPSTVRSLGSMTRRPQTSSSSSSSKSAVSEAIASSHKIPLKRNNSNGLTWGRSPARDMHHQDTQRVLSSHPAYRKVNRTRSGDSVSSVSSTDGPKRSSSLMGMIWGS